MIRLATLVLPGAYHASIGAMLDSCSLVQDRLHYVVAENSGLPSKIELSTLSVDGKPVRIGGDVLYNVDRALSSVDDFHMIWLPSFRIGTVERVRRWLQGSKQLTNWLCDRAEAGATIAASGASAMVLVRAGLLEDKRVPASRPMAPTVKELCPHSRVDQDMILADYGNILIGNGASSDFLVIERALTRTVSPYSGRWLAEVTGADHPERAHAAKDSLVQSAQMWIEQFYASDLTIDDLAAKLSVSHQTLTRRFKSALGMTPKAYMQQMRVVAAQKMLEYTSRSIDDVARMVGYSDTRIFRSAFHKHTGSAPKKWRATAFVVDDKNHPVIDD